MRIALVAVVCAGCAKPGDPVAFETQVYVNQLGDRMQVNAPGYEVSFPTRAGAIGMPDSLLINGVQEAFAQGSCPDESLAGVAVYPSALAAGGEAGESQVTIVHGGPGVVQIRVEYDVAYSCQGAQHLTGQSTFTFFPSGRIVRHDAASPQTNPYDRASGCGCQTSGQAENLWFTSYYTFANPIVDAGGTPLTSGAAADASCAVVGPHLVGVAWSPGLTRVQNTGDNLWASVYDFDRGQLTLATRVEEVTSALQIGFDIGSQNCGVVLEGLVDNAITIDGGMQLATNEHGYYTDDTRRTEAFTITVTERTPGFAASFDLGSSSHARVTRSTETTPGWYTVQADAERVLFWFADGLEPGESITIEPL